MTSSLQVSEDELFETAMGILRLVERQRTRLFVRRDAYGRFLSCLIYLPRENSQHGVARTDRADPDEGVQRDQRGAHGPFL